MNMWNSWGNVEKHIHKWGDNGIQYTNNMGYMSACLKMEDAPPKKKTSNIADEPLVGMGYSILRQAHLKLFFGLKLGI